MEAQHGHSAACCNIPPIIAKDYKAKGKYETIGGTKTYVTGPSDATTAILFIFDIFGYFPQSLQGADILATSGKDHKYQVFMPDFFDGKPVPIEWYPPDNEEKQKKLGEFFQTTGAPAKAVEKVPGLIKSFNEFNPNIKKWGAIGFCWGGKVISLTSGAGTKYSASASSSPAMVDPADAEKITIPTLMIASKDEDAEAVKKFEANLKVPKHVEIFSSEIHGFMTARGDLENETTRKEYERGYKTALDFFAKHL